MNHRRKLITQKFTTLFLLLNLFVFSDLAAQCLIGDLFIETSTCNDLNEFSVTIDFEHAGTTNTFSLAGNGNDYGDFSYTDLPITITSPLLIGDGNSIYEFVVLDNVFQNDCSNWGVVGPISCGAGNCEILNPVIEIGDCNFDAHYLVFIDFSVTNATSDSFTIHNNNGQLISHSSLSDLPLTLLLPSNNNDIDLVQICIDNEPGCCFVFSYIPPTCLDGSCFIGGMSYSATDCDDQGFYYFTPLFGYYNTSDSFNIINTDNNINIGTYAYNDPNISAGPLVANEPYIFIIQDQVNNNCFSPLLTVWQDCSPPACEMGNLSLSTADCDNSGNYFINIDLDYANASDSFVLMLQGYQSAPQTYPYTDLPLTVGPINSGNIQTVVGLASDQLDPNCASDFLYITDCFLFCEISNLSISATDCTPNAVFDVTIDFNYANTSSTFTIVGNGQNYGTFNYTDLPITIPSLEANGTVYEFIIQDTQQSDCGGELIWQSEDCTAGNCALGAVTFDYFDCNADGSYSISLDFDYANSSDSFSLTGNNINLGNAAYADLPITIGPVSFQTIGFLVTDLEQPNCTTGGFSDYDCSQNCTIEYIVMTDVCVGDGTYTLYLAADYTGTSDSFQLELNQEIIGNFAYVDQPIEVGTFPASGTVELIALATDLLYPNCTAETNYTVQCPGNSCEMSNLTLTTADCDNSGNYFLNIDLDYANSSDSFILMLQGYQNAPQTYAYADLPLTVGPINSGNIQTVVGLASDQLDPNCASDFLYVTDCFLFCEISNLSISATDCTPNAVFDAIIDFDYVNTSGTFTVVGNGQNYGTFNYTDLPITIPSLDANGSIYEFIIQDSQQSDCGGVLSWQSEDCTAGNCAITALDVAVGDCGPSGYFVTINFAYQNPGNDFFDLFGNNGQFLGFFELTQLPLTMEFPASGNDYDFLQVCINDMPTCCQAIEFMAPDCTGPTCEISNLSISATDCTPNAVFDAIIDFDYVNTSGTFTVVGNGQNYGTFNYTDLPITIPSLDANGSIYEFIIQDSQQSDCGGVLSWQSEYCTFENCATWDLILTPSSCTPDGLFSISIDFNSDTTSNSGSFTITGNGQTYGTFNYDDLPVTIPSLEANGSIYEFLIQDSQQTDCDVEWFIQSENCICEIGPLTFDYYDCDQGNYFISIDFDHTNTNGFFTLIGNNIDYGNFAYTDLPIEIGPVDAQTILFVVADLEYPDCSSEVLSVYNCGNYCEIWDMVITATDCTPNATFDAIIDFNYAYTSNTFTITGNGQNYGTFDYTDLPITIPSLEANGSVYEFLIEDTQQSDCGGVLIWQSEDCTTGNCAISGLFMEAYACDDLGMFLVDLTFDYVNTSDSFTVVGNGQNYGTFAYSDLFVTVGPFVGDGSTYELIVQDQEQTDCGGELVWQSEDCTTGNCAISGLFMEAYACDDLGMFLVDLTFDYVNTSDSFTVVGNGQNYGTFAYSDLFVTVGPFVGDGSTYELIVQDQEQTDCGGELVFQSENCANTDCEITGLNAYPLNCNPDGTYSVLILFDYENVSGDTFDIYSNGTYLGSSLYDDIPLTIPSFLGSGNDVDELTICDNNSDLCCETIAFEALDCNNCEIFDVVATPGTCDSEDNFMVNLDFGNTGGGPLGFIVLGNGNNYGNFNYTDLPISLGPFEGNGTTVYEFIIVDLANTDCIGLTMIDPILCGVPPPVWPGDINNNNIADNFDLLGLGVAYGEIGPARAQSSNDWLAWEAPEWSAVFSNDVNKKHADCNGDGIVDDLDLSAIDLNYNQINGDVIPLDTIAVSPDDPPFYVELPTVDEIVLGEAFAAPIILGTLETPIEEIYGIAFTIEYDPSMMDEAGVYVETGNSWLGEQGSQLININKSFSNQGLIEVAITRIDHNNTGGHGVISYFIGIIDDIAGKTELNVSISNVMAITFDETQIPIAALSSVIDLATNTSDILKQDFSIFPNPANETVNVLFESDLLPENIIVYNNLGQQITQIMAPQKWERLNVSTWSEGIYFVNLQFKEGIISRKVTVMR